MELFEDLNSGGEERAYQPLADRLRPKSWDAFQGIEAIDANLIAQLKSGSGNPPSMVLWGPPGSGKTTLAKLIGNSYEARFVEFSAVLAGVKEVREVVAQAKLVRRRTILFVDEIHRFNRAQQDAFLPHIEAGTIILIGATTENPSFYLTGALLSRVKVIQLPPLSDVSLGRILEGAARELGLKFEKEALEVACSYAGGDARRLLNLVEGFPLKEGVVTRSQLQNFLQDQKTLFYDRSGEEHYNMISAFIKSMRGSDPDAALFWGFRMLESGEDARFLIRRMIIFASEDISNADPRALQLALATAEAFERLGLPEGRIVIAQCITYLASAPKSNRSYMAMHAAVAAVKERAKVEVPLHLRNAPTKLMEEFGYGKEYIYPHSTSGGFAPQVCYLPDELEGTIFYEPTERGYEKMIKERLDYFRSLRKRNV
ncbi:MAG: replication-associated recombination protein A [Deltaproteobacteria bacterium]|nr:replication-associated recombination protein A [Deltaproteobacteria bacterium]